MSNENNMVRFRIGGIKTEQFAVFENLYDEKKAVDIGTNLGFKVDIHNRFIACFSTIEFAHSGTVFLKLQVSCHFNVEPVAWKTFEREEATKLVVPRGFATHLALITIGTVRGILFSKTEATPFAKFILPTINVEEMIENDMIFTLPNGAVRSGDNDHKNQAT